MARSFLVVAALLAVRDPARAQDLELRFDHITPEQLEPFVRRVLDSASRSLDRLLSQTGKRTVANNLRPYHDYRIIINRARVVPVLIDPHPDSTVRSAAFRAATLLSTFQQRRRADRRIYDMLRAVDLRDADAEVKFWV